MTELFTGSAIESAVSAANASAAATDETAASTASSTAAGADPVEGTATTQPAAEAQPGTDTTQPQQQTAKTDEQKKGPIPFPVHETALANARAKERAEVEGQYAWAKGIDERHRGTVQEFYRLLDGAPDQAAERVIVTALSDPQHASAMRSMLGRLLGTRGTGQPAARQDTGGGLPDPDYEDQATGAKFLSYERIPELVDAIERRIEAKYSSRLGPLEQDHRTRQQRAEEAERQREARDWAAAEHARIAKEYPHYAEHETEIGQAMEADPDLTVQEAYIRIVVPKLSALELKKVVADQQHKSSAASINPQGSTAGALPPPKTFEEGFARMAGSL